MEYFNSSPLRNGLSKHTRTITQDSEIDLLSIVFWIVCGPKNCEELCICDDVGFVFRCQSRDILHYIEGVMDQNVYLSILKYNLLGKQETNSIKITIQNVGFKKYIAGSCATIPISWRHLSKAMQ